MKKIDYIRMSNKQKWATVIVPIIIFLLFSLFATGQNGIVITEMQDNDGDGLHDEFTLIGNGFAHISTSPANGWMGGTMQAISSQSKSGVAFNIFPKTSGQHVLRFRYMSSHPLFVVITTTNGYKYVIAHLPSTSTLFPELCSIEYVLPHKQRKAEVFIKTNSSSWMIIDDIVSDPIGLLEETVVHSSPILIQKPVDLEDLDVLGRRIEK